MWTNLHIISLSLHLSLHIYLCECLSLSLFVSLSVSLSLSVSVCVSVCFMCVPCVSRVCLLCLCLCVCVCVRACVCVFARCVCICASIMWCSTGFRFLTIMAGGRMGTIAENRIVAQICVTFLWFRVYTYFILRGCHWGGFWATPPQRRARRAL